MSTLRSQNDIDIEWRNIHKDFDDVENKRNSRSVTLTSVALRSFALVEEALELGISKEGLLKDLRKLTLRFDTIAMPAYRHRLEPEYAHLTLIEARQVMYGLEADLTGEPVPEVDVDQLVQESMDRTSRRHRVVKSSFRPRTAQSKIDFNAEGGFLKGTREELVDLEWRKIHEKISDCVEWGSVTESMMEALPYDVSKAIIYSAENDCPALEIYKKLKDVIDRVDAVKSRASSEPRRSQECFLEARRRLEGLKVKMEGKSAPFWDTPTMTRGHRRNAQKVSATLTPSIER